MKRLALLIPARNASPFLGRLLDSVDAQTHRFGEVLLYDDASTDDTGRIAIERGVRVVRSEVNTGPSRGKNRLAGMTTCEWVHFHDADDALDRDFVKHASHWLERDDADVVLFGTKDLDGATGATLRTRTWDDRALQDDAVRYAVVHTITNCGVYRRAAFLDAGGFDTSPAAKYNEDQAMHLALALGGLRFRADPYVGVLLYQRAGSMSSANRIECAQAQIDVLARVAERTGNTYAQEIGARLWALAGVSAGYSDWQYVKRSLAISAALGYHDPRDEHWAIRAMALANPMLAVRAREALIRLLKPHLRVGMPNLFQRARAEMAPVVDRREARL